MMEGLFWKRIRGTGLAYGTSLSFNVEPSQLTFNIRRSANAALAFAQANAVVKELLNDDIHFDSVTLEAARSGAMFAIISTGV